MSLRRVISTVGSFGCVLIFPLVMWAGTAVAENSKFHGTFDMTMSGTEPDPWTEAGRLRIGSDQSKMREESYLHIPPDGNPVTNAWTEEDGAPVSQVITIAEDAITVDQRRDCLDGAGVRFVCFTKHLEFAFSSGYVGAAVSGSIWSNDPEENQGLVTGSLARVADDGGGGGGCFIGAAIARGF
ncbi:MAG: hypothetical protein SWQ30_04795 [Thermodesulfobacteriota bacterium]|nr:hypothetical protein [Thermodesulfobacteriota bacterium]